MTQVLSQPPALPRMGDRLFLAGASPYSKVTAAAKRKRDYRDAGFRGSCQTCEASSKRAPDAQAAPEVRALGRLQAAGGARTRPTRRQHQRCTRWGGCRPQVAPGRAG